MPIHSSDPTYPTTAANDGARHKDVSNEWLGKNVNTESIPQMPDQDPFDDGVGSVAFKPCEIVEIPVTVTVKDRENSNHSYSGNANEVLYLNMVFDFDKKGTWGFDTTKCDDTPVNEWQVRNHEVDVSLWPQGETSQTFNVPVQVGELGGPICFRASLTYGEKVGTDEWIGIGEFEFGETEDYCPFVGADTFCGDGVVDPFFEMCDPPGSVCAFDGFVVYLCNNLCECIVPDKPKFLCNDEADSRSDPYIPGAHVCEDNCLFGEICDAATCECEEGPKDYDCYNGEGWINEGYRGGVDACNDNCPEGLVCDSTCNCVDDDRSEVSCAEYTDETHTDETKFNLTTQICKDDCSTGFKCDVTTCICEEIEEVSCAENTDLVDQTDENNFDLSEQACKDDCEQGYQCTASSCTCTPIPEVSCAQNTDDVIETDINDYDSSTQVCQDDCETGFECNSSSCTCTAVESTEFSVLIIGGLNYPTFQFIQGGGEDHSSCPPLHWHIAALAFAIGDTSGISDPDPDYCGVGEVGQVAEGTVQITPEEDELLQGLFYNQ